MIVFLIAAALFERDRIVWALAGTAPGFAIYAFFKFFIARESKSWMAGSTSSLLGNVVNIERYTTILKSIGGELWNMTNGFYHPFLPPLILMCALRVSMSQRRDMLLAGTATAAMMAGYFLAYLITPLDLAWQLQTSLQRLIAQVWPCVLLTIFVAVRAPETFSIDSRAVEPEAVTPLSDKL